MAILGISAETNASAQAAHLGYVSAAIVLAAPSKPTVRPAAAVTPLIAEIVMQAAPAHWPAEAGRWGSVRRRTEKLIEKTLFFGKLY